MRDYLFISPYTLVSEKSRSIGGNIRGFCCLQSAVCCLLPAVCCLMPALYGMVSAHLLPGFLLITHIGGTHL